MYCFYALAIQNKSIKVLILTYKIIVKKTTRKDFFHFYITFCIYFKTNEKCANLLFSFKCSEITHD